MPAQTSDEARVQVSKTFPIRTVARLTGLTPDLIRAWERRHRVVAPVRGPRGARLYGADDVARLSLLARIVASGHSIGDVAHLPPDELERALQTSEREPASVSFSGASASVDALLGAVGRMDVAALEAGLNQALLALGPSDFAIRVAAPLLHEVGERWQAGEFSIGHEHLISNALRSLLGSLGRTRRMASAASLALTTVSGERHELGLLLVGVLAAEQGIVVYLLGPDLPAADIVRTTTSLGATTLGLSFVACDNRATATAELASIQASLPKSVAIWAGGCDASHVVARSADGRTEVLQNLDDVISRLAQLRTLALPI